MVNSASCCFSAPADLLYILMQCYLLICNHLYSDCSQTLLQEKILFLFFSFAHSFLPSFFLKLSLTTVCLWRLRVLWHLHWNYCPTQVFRRQISGIAPNEFVHFDYCWVDFFFVADCFCYFACSRWLNFHCHSPDLSFWFTAAIYFNTSMIPFHPLFIFFNACIRHRHCAEQHVDTI